MRHAKQTNHTKSFIRKSSIPALITLALLGLAPAQAQASEVCNSEIRINGVQGLTPFFVGDELILNATVGADLIRDEAPLNPDPYIDFTGLGYGLDCGGGTMNVLSDCKPTGFGIYPPENTGHDIEFLGVISHTCSGPGGASNFPTPESDNIVSIPALNPPVRFYWDPVTQTGETCDINLKFVVNELHEHSNWVAQALGVPFDNRTPDFSDDDMVGQCSNGLSATEHSKTVFRVNTCDIMVDKQVSLTGEDEDWHDLETPYIGDDVYYRLVVTNTGSAPLLGNVVVNDEQLGVVDVPVPSGGLEPEATMIIGGGQVTAFDAAARCVEEGEFENIASVQAWCRGDADSAGAVWSLKEDNAILDCRRREEPKEPAIQIIKDGDLDLGDNGIADADVDVIDYTFDVTNTGNVPLSNVLVTDPLVADIACEDADTNPLDNVNGFPLAVSETVYCTGQYTITQDDINAGERLNTATAEGDSPDGVTPPTVSDNDDHEEPIPTEPGIDIEKYISLDNAEPWLDADDSGSALETTFPSGAYYKIVVENTGNEALTGVVVNDPQLGIVDHLIGSLAVGQTVTLTSGEIAALDKSGAVLCETHEEFTNIADVAGVPVTSGGSVDDADAAVLSCVGIPAIEIYKQISLTGEDGSWEEHEVSAMYPSKVFYRMIVMNSGTEPLVDVIVTDNDLVPPFSYEIGDLDVGESVILAAGDNDPPPPEGTVEFEQLIVSDPCNAPGDRVNTAHVSGYNFWDDTDEVTDDDPAKLICEGQPGIEIEKQVRVGQNGWKDADDVPSALVGQAPLDVEYRFIVENVGEADLVNVVINDSKLNIVDYPVGDLPQGTIAVIHAQSCDGYPAGTCFVEPKLDPTIPVCDGPAQVINTAYAAGESADNGSPAESSDPAYVVCTGTPDILIVKEVGVCEWVDVVDDDVERTVRIKDTEPRLMTVDKRKDDDSSSGGEPPVDKECVVTWYRHDDAPEQDSPADAWYRFTIENIGTEDLTDVTLFDDPILQSIYPLGYLIGNLGVNDDPIVIDEGAIPELYVANACNGNEDIHNIAEVLGVGPSGLVQSSDWALLSCREDVEICVNGEKPKYLTVEYDADDDTDHDQSGKQVMIEPPSVTFPAGAVTIKVYGKKGEYLATHHGVMPGDELRINLHRQNELKFEIYDGPGGALLQKVKFHVSCSMPLNAGDEFGAITVKR